jgi:glycine/D-amino acid oxidase-like deaminating enzyme
MCLLCDAVPAPLPALPEPGAADPWWLTESGLLDEPEAPELTGKVDADVAVIGGGYTGMWTALALRERDPRLRVVVLERTRCGLGPSGRNGGFLHGYWSSVGWLRELLPDELVLQLAHAGDRVIPAVEEFAERRDEDVWLRRGGLLKVSTTLEHDARIDAAITAAKDLDSPDEAVPLDRDALTELCRSPRFRRGVLFRDGATVQPARLVKALRRALLDDEGVVLHERSPAIHLEKGRPNVVETPRGRVSAREVVLAVNAAAAGWRPLAGKLTNFGSYVVLTEPVPELLDELQWTGGQAITDARMFLHYFRTTPDGRVLMGSGSGPIGLGGRIDERFTHDRPSAARAESGLRTLLPMLADARITHAWGGPIDVSADRLPFVGTLPEGHVHYAAGFSGNGVGPSWLAAQTLASLAAGRDDEWTALPLIGRRMRRLPPEPIKRLGGGVVRAAALALEEAEETGRRPSRVAQAVVSVPRLLGLRLGLR